MKYTVRPARYVFASTDGGRTRRRVYTDRGYNGYTRHEYYKYTQMNFMQRFMYRRRMAIKNWKRNVLSPWLRYTVRPFILKWVVTPTLVAVFLFLLFSWLKTQYNSAPEVFQNANAQTETTKVVGIERYVKTIPPIMKRVAGCESAGSPLKAGQQFDEKGKVIHGQKDPHDIGKYQISEPNNGELAKKLGYDIYTEKGNEGFAMYLYEHRGTEPWSASRNCWR